MKELHLFGKDASASDVIAAIEHLSGGQYSWVPVNEPPPIFVPDRITAKYRRLMNAEAVLTLQELVTARQTDWKVIVPTLRKLLPKHTPKDDAAILLDMLLVTYAINMGVGIPYMAIA